MTDRTSLTPRDWTLAGIAALAEGGVDAVRVERLAKQLGTSKGSFYWHFADRPALLTAMLDLWEREGTADLISRIAHLDDPAARLRLLMAEALAQTTEGIDVARTEAALRSWAAQDPSTGQRFAAVETARTQYLTGELTLLGYAPTAALRLSRALYLALIGLYAARRYAAELADDGALVDLLEQIITAAPARQAP